MKALVRTPDTYRPTKKKKKNFNETSNIRIVLPECLWAPRPRPVELKMSQHAHEIGESHVTVAFIDDKL